VPAEPETPPGSLPAQPIAPPNRRLSEIPYPVLWVAGLFVPLVRELRTTRCQFVLCFVVDSSLTEQTFGLAPTDLDVALRAVSHG
jgi:hypothetical protein